MKYFSAFSGIGGFEKGIIDAGLDWECVGYSEIDKYAKAIYNVHFNHIDYGDITTINEFGMPDFDLFVGGFPCQAFSIAGKRQGFEDTRGTLFFDVARILSAKKPRWVVLENVKGLLNHESGRTFSTIYGVLTELGYSVGWEVVNSCHFGVPQNRERIFIIGHLGKGGVGKIFPIREETQGANEGSKQAPVVRILTAGGNSGGLHSSMTLIGDFRYDEGFRWRDSGLEPTLNAGGGNNPSKDVLVKSVLTPDRPEKRQNGRRFKEAGEPMFTLTAQDRHGVLIHEATKKGYDVAHEGDAISIERPNSKTRRGRVGKGVANTLDTKAQQGTLVNERIRRLTPIECERLQGFPDSWTAKGILKGKEIEISDSQ